jgi:predicted RNase H-like HicB family nuclease
MQYEFTVVIERDEDGAYIATVPALPGCHTAGDTEEEALELIKDAIRLHIEARLAAGEPIPRDIDSAKVRIAV